MEWFSWVVAIILLISSVISPWLVNKENNKHQLELKKLDMYENAKRKALSEFIEYSEDYLLNNTYVEQNVKYYVSLNKLFLYFDNIDLKTFTSFEAATKKNDYSIATYELSKIVQELSKQIKKQ